MGKKSHYIFWRLIPAAVVALSSVFFCLRPLFAEPSEMNEKYKELFQLYNDVELMKSKRTKLESELVLLERNIASSSAALKNGQAEIDRRLDDYAEMLRLRQRSGETSQLKIVLSSKHISDFLFRMNITETIHNRYAELVDALDENLQEETRLRQNLEQDRRMTMKKKAEIEASISEKEKNIKKLEAYLLSKGSAREEYERQLKILGDKWSELKPLFAGTIRSFVRLIESGGLPDDVIEVRFSIAGIRGIVREEVFNRLLAEAFQNQKDATEIVFRAKDGGVYVYVPSHEVELFGSFDVTGNTLIYRVERGTFSGIEIGPSGIEDLFMGGKFEIDVTHILNIMSMELLDCRVEDGYIDVGIKLKP